MGDVSEQRPVWRQGFDAVERTVSPPLTAVVNSEQFAIGVGLVAHLQKAIQARTERATRRVLHQWNLPAGSDITRIIAEIGTLQAQVRDISRQLHTLKEEERHGEPDSARRAPRARQERR